MDDNTRRARVAAIIAVAIVTGFMGLIGSGLYACIDGHRSDVQVAKESNAWKSTCPQSSASVREK
jgi:hypothetical protein